MKTILVPTDFSECALYALNYACYLAEKTNSRIILLHVLNVFQIDSPVREGELWMKRQQTAERLTEEVPLMLELLRSVRRKMNALMNLPQCKKISMMDSIETGNIGTRVNASAKKNNADMIVMGTHGTSGLNEIFLGSNAEHVVRDVEIPVLSVKEGHVKPEIKTIVFATDFSEETNLIFPSIKNFAEIFNAEVHLVKISSAPNSAKRGEMKKMLSKFVSGNEKNISTHFYYHQIKEAGIRYFADAVNADLITLGTHGRHGLALFFRGSVAEDVVNHSPLPVLTINFHKKQLKKMQSGKKINAEETLEETKISETLFSGHIPAL
ncbi:MAG: universal stress protein [Bacteroidetes bacterium]|nr:universal stress protein [Bacteroidota bacterium]